MSEHRGAVAPIRARPAGFPGIDTLDARAGDENFPVASRLLPASLRADLVAIYGFARLADQLGDDYPGDRQAALNWLERDLEAVTSGQAVHPAVARLGPTIEAHGLGLEPFRDLIDANRRDQVQRRYETFDDLLDYCRLSANPVGRLVLTVFGVESDRAIELSDRVCTGLQVVEHVQDVAEDHRAGRIYIPQADLRRYGCAEADLAATVASPPLRRVIELQVARAAALLDAGDDLVPLVPGRGRIAVAGFVAGGRAALDAVVSCDHDVLAHHCRPSGRRLVAHLIRLLRPRGRRSDHDEVS